ncbi:MAG: YggS family pyridoxal phosphate-dependent enzyme [Acidobacteriota bacterium]
MTLRERIDQVETRIQNAAARAGRSRESITLIAVTKKFSAEVVREAYDLGMRVFGENYVQEFSTKQPELADLSEAHFHLIGHLQSNKSRMATQLFQTIQTVDSVRLAQRLQEACVEGNSTLNVMIEVKLSVEEAKFGATPEQLAELKDAIQACPNLKLDGLMTMPPWSDNPEETRPYFRKLATLADQFGLMQLSMGMSHDLEAAIEEGATHVRIGTALFGPRPKPLA